jgi:hypothetical protein
MLVGQDNWAEWGIGVIFGWGDLWIISTNSQGMGPRAGSCSLRNYGTVAWQHDSLLGSWQGP